MASTVKPDTVTSRLPQLLEKHESELISKWITEQLAAISTRRDLIKESDLRDESRRFLLTLRTAAQEGASLDISKPHWSAMRDFLTDLSRSRANLGFTQSETALFVFSLRPVLLDQIQAEFGHDVGQLAAVMRTVTDLLDKLGLFTVDTHLKAREQIIARQREEMIELSTPVVSLLEGVLAVPLI